MDDGQATGDKDGAGARANNGTEGSTGRKAWLAAGAALLLVVAGLAWFLVLREAPQAPAPTGTPGGLQEHNSSYMSIRASSIGRTASFFEYNTSGTTIRFFAVRDGKGTIRTAFDECPQCYGARLGFRQQGADMVENCCNMSFPIDSIGPGAAGCHPEHLSSRIEGGLLMISKRDIMGGAYLFARSGPPSEPIEYNMTAIAIPLSSFGTNATWYRYNVSGAAVRFFAVKDARGSVHAGFDECPMCYGNHLGFRQEGDMIVENCCDMAFPIENITAEGCNITGCRPVHLASRVEGDNLMVAKSALAAQARLFRTANEFEGVEDLDAATVAVNFSLASGQARWFEYGINGTVVRFFMVKDQNGTVHASLDTCMKCYKKHAGFRQDGSSMVENCCNMAYAIDNITAERCTGPGCHPEFLPSQVADGRVLLARADIEAGSFMFKPGGR